MTITSGPPPGGRSRFVRTVLGAIALVTGSSTALATLLAMVGQLYVRFTGQLDPENHDWLLQALVAEGFMVLLSALAAAWGLRTMRHARQPAPPE